MLFSVNVNAAINADVKRAIENEQVAMGDDVYTPGKLMQKPELTFNEAMLLLQVAIDLGERLRGKLFVKNSDGYEYNKFGLRKIRWMYLLTSIAEVMTIAILKTDYTEKAARFLSQKR